MSGPLTGVRVLELGGIGPAPHAAMLAADLGAEVVRVVRPGAGAYGGGGWAWEPRGCRSVALDLKADAGRALLLELATAADVLIDPFRPGVAERLGVGPETCLAANPGLVYGRITGWGQDGPDARTAGHDINYLAASGLLHAVGPADHRPVPPLSMVGDFGGGSMLLVVGILAALVERARSGRGQVIDAAMLDGALLLGDLVLAQHSAGLWTDRRGDNLLDGGAPFYRTYECADGRHVAVGAIEPQFFAELAAVLDLPVPAGFDHTDRANWPQVEEWLDTAFRSRGRDEWTAAFDGRDACVTPVLSLAEMPTHPQVAGRRLVVEQDGVRRAAPAPRFSRTPARAGTVSAEPLDPTALAGRWHADRAGQDPAGNRRASSSDQA